MTPLQPIWSGQRPGRVAAVTALEQAARLSVDATRRVELLLRAADLAVEMGRRDVVARLLRAAETVDLSPQQRARVWIRESFDDGMRDQTAGARMLASLAETVAAGGDTTLGYGSCGVRRCDASGPSRESRPARTSWPSPRRYRSTSWICSW
jgi:hypothetical protein